MRSKYQGMYFIVIRLMLAGTLPAAVLVPLVIRHNFVWIPGSYWLNLIAIFTTMWAVSMFWFAGFIFYPLRNRNDEFKFVSFYKIKTQGVSESKVKSILITMGYSQPENSMNNSMSKFVVHEEGIMGKLREVWEITVTYSPETDELLFSVGRMKGPDPRQLSFKEAMKFKQRSQ